MAKKVLWKAIEGWEGFYEVSNDNRVRSLPRSITDKKGITKQLQGVFIRPDKTGGIWLARGGKYTVRSLKALVNQAFAAPVEEKEEVTE